MDQLISRNISGWGKRLAGYLLIGCILLSVSCLIASSIVAELDPYDSRILDNVSVGGLDIGGMTRETAYRTLKEANETYYWLKLLYRTSYLNAREFASMEKDIREIVAIIAAICKKTNI